MLGGKGCPYCQVGLTLLKLEDEIFERINE
jgi:hypothetical protein